MQSKDIVLQVSEETAEVMEEISEQLFDESEARFDEIVEAIEGAVKKVEGLYAEFTGYTANSNKQATANQNELIDKFVVVLDAIAAFRKDANDQAGQVSEKTERLLTIMADVPQLIQDILKSIADTSAEHKEFDATLLKTVHSLAESLAELQKVQSGIANKLDNDDSGEKLTSALNKLSEIEKEILQTQTAIGNVSETLRNCNSLIEQLLSSVKDLQANDEKILGVDESNSKKVDDLGKHTEETSKLLLDKMGDILSCLDTLSCSIQSVSEKQGELCEKQAELEKDVKYLKLPFFKRWFTKG